MKTKYRELYQKHVADGRDKEIMKLWGECDKWDFDYLVDNHPQIAEMLLEKRIGAIEAKQWNNYLTVKEAKIIMTKMNPSAQWSIDDIKSACVTLGVLDEEPPYFNCYALAVMMNSLMSDHRKSYEKVFTDKTALVTFVYEQAVEKLKDIDRTNYIRAYYDLY